MALYVTHNMATWNVTANGVTFEQGVPELYNGTCLLPPFLDPYFKEKSPGGISEWDIYSYLYPNVLVTGKGMTYTKTWGIPNKSFYFPTFAEFVLCGGWNDKHLKEIPGIGETYATRMKTSLKGYCSVPQLYDMYCYWWSKGVPENFYHLLYWASAAYNNNGKMHIERAYQAFGKKHLLCLPGVVPMNVKIEEPFPYLLEE